MPSGQYSYIDIAALNTVRARFAAGDALAVLTPTLDEVIWANGQGAALFGYSDIGSIIGKEPEIGLVAKRQIMAAPGYPHIGHDRAMTVRLAGRAASFLASEIALPGGEDAILLAAPATAAAWQSPAETAARAIAGLDQAGQHAAIIDAGGKVVAASSGFEGLAIGGDALGTLVAEAASERLIKRMVEAGTAYLPAGFVRLLDAPATHLLVVVDEVPAEEAAPEEQAEIPVQDDAARSEKEFDPHSGSLPPSPFGLRRTGREPPLPRSTGERWGAEVVAGFPLPTESGGDTSAPTGDVEGSRRDIWYFAERSHDAAHGVPENEPAEAYNPATAIPEDAETATNEEAIPIEVTGGDASAEAETQVAEAASSEEGMKRSDEAKVSSAGTREEEAPVAAGEAQAVEAEAEPAEDVPEPTSAEEALEPVLEPPAPVAADRSTAPVRFVWKTDSEGRFSEISEDFVRTVGRPAADLIGVTFRDAAAKLGIDPGGEITGLLARRDTWSGRSVLWPVAGTDLRIPVDLAALPSYARDREFAGFRGFGVARADDAIVDPQAVGLMLVEARADGLSPPVPTRPSATDAAVLSETDEAVRHAPAGNGEVEDESREQTPDPFQGEVPALSIASGQDRRQSDKVIRLAEHRPNNGDKGLSAGERNAFREIGDRLRRDAEAPVELRADNDHKPAAVPAQEPGPETEESRLRDEASSGENLQAAAETINQLLAAGEGAAEAVEVEKIAQPERVGTTGGEASDEESGEREKPEQISVSAETLERITPTPDPSPQGGGELGVIAGRAEPSTVVHEPAATSSPSPLWRGDRGADAPRFVPSAFATAPAAPRPPVDTTILEQLPLPVLIHSGDALHYANREFLEFTGYDSVAELHEAGGLGALFGEPYARDDDDGEEGRKLRLRTSEGLEYPVEAFLQSVPWSEGKALLLSLRRSWRHPVSYPASPPSALAAPADPELEERIAEMRAIVDTATDGVVLIARDGTIRSISSPAEALFGFDSDDVAGKPFTSLFAIESQRAARDYLAGLSENGVASVLNDGREVIGREAQGRFIPLFMTIGRLPNDSGFCAVVRDITQWKRAEEELTQARAQAERASSQKTEFLARVSHEIRTPLNAIIGFSELMLDEKFGPILNDRYRDYLRDINRSGNHVLDIVNDLLDISKIEAGQQEMSYEAVSLNDTLAETVAMMQPQANRERVIIRSSFASRLPEVVADLRSVRQIALNLMSNAVRYTPAGGQVIVSTAYEASGDVVMRVRDTGIGMSPAEIEQALKPFKQINALKRPRGDGTGLGLPLTKAMVEANRARFMINSTPGEGTLVEITFPSTRVLAD